MNNKITRKLVLYFSITLLLFSTVIGIAFTILFSKQTKNVHIEKLEQRATAIANYLSDYISERESTQQAVSSMHMGMHGKNKKMNYLQSLDQLSLDDTLWVVDQSEQQITVCKTLTNKPYSTLPNEAKKMVSMAYKDQMTTSEAFSTYIGTPTVTVSVPVKNDAQKVVSVVLLHSAISTVHKSEQQGYIILIISIALAWIIGIILAMSLSKKFIAPLNQMRFFTDRLMAEDFNTQLTIDSHDELGLLGEKLAILQERLAEAKNQRETKEQSQKNFLSTVSHELRTPITVIRGSLELLKDGIVTEPKKVQQHYQQLLTEAIMLERLTNDLLELSRLENPEFSIEKEIVDVFDILSDSVRSLKMKMENKKQLLTIQNDWTQAVNISGDYGRIRQLFSILIDNACKFAPKNTVISIHLFQEGQHYKIAIHNDGSYISEKHQNMIFQRFHQVQSDQPTEGTGLGLAIAKEIAERHDIQLDVSSSKDTGTTFTVII